MASELAKKAAGTYVKDSLHRLPAVYAWFSEQCRTGSLSEAVRQFCEQQPEIMDQRLLVVEGVSQECVQCRIPFKCYDHETDGTFGMDVCFELNPQTRRTQRR